MSGNALVFDGLEELREALRHLPDELTAEAGHIVEAATYGAEADIKRGYHRVSGELQDATEASVETSGFSVVGTVRNRSKIAWIYENGTQARHTELGANRGVMPPGHVFIPVMQRKRRQTYERLKELLVRKGLIVVDE